MYTMSEEKKKKTCTKEQENTLKGCYQYRMHYFSQIMYYLLNYLSKKKKIKVKNQGNREYFNNLKFVVMSKSTDALRRLNLITQEKIQTEIRRKNMTYKNATDDKFNINRELT